MLESSLDGANEVQVPLYDQNFWSNPHFPEGVFSDLVPLGQDIENRAIKMAFIFFFVVFDALINRLRVTKTNFTNALTLQQLLRLEKALVDQILEPV